MRTSHASALIGALFTLMLAAPTPAQDAHAAWGSVCSQYGFLADSSDPAATFADVYFGPPAYAQANLDAAIAATAKVLATSTPRPSIDDNLDATLDNWPAF